MSLEFGLEDIDRLLITDNYAVEEHSTVLVPADVKVSDHQGLR